MKNYIRTVSLAKVLLVAILALAAATPCAQAENSAEPVQTKEVKKPSATITKGMPQEEVLKLLGEPDSKRRQKASDGSYVEFWNYRRIIGQTENYQVVGAEMVEVFSPSLGEWIMVPEEIEELVRTTYVQRAEIIMHKGKVLTFKANVEQDIEVI